MTKLQKRYISMMLFVRTQEIKKEIDDIETEEENPTKWMSLSAELKLIDSILAQTMNSKEKKNDKDKCLDS